MKRRLILSLAVCAGWFVAASASIATPMGACTGSGGNTLCTITEVSGPGTTDDGTIFAPEPNPTSPSTGTGVFEPFVRIQATGSSSLRVSAQEGGQQGFNTDAKEPGINFDTKSGKWTHSITFSDLQAGQGGGYIALSLDANEPGGARTEINQIDISEIQIFAGDSRFANPEENAKENGFVVPDPGNGILNLGTGARLLYDLDSVADVTVRLDASVCDAAGQCGSGHGDMTMLIPDHYFVGKVKDDEQIVFFSRYALAGGASGGFSEWRVGPPIPEPNAALVFAVGGLIVGTAVRRLRA